MFEFFHSFENVFYYPFLKKTYDLFSKTDVISFPFLSFVLHFSLFSFQGAILGLNPNFNP